MTNYTAMTLKHLRAEGWRATVVERWHPHSQRRSDAFGFGDILAFRDDETLLVQSTTASNISSRIQKINVIPEATEWMSGGRRIWVIGWRKYKQPVDRKYWRPIVRRLEDE